MNTPEIITGSGRKKDFSLLTVRGAMRKRVITLTEEASIDDAIGQFIKQKVNAILILDAEGHPMGVLSKTEIVGAYYAELPLVTPASSIMNSPVHTCFPADSLELALSTMQETRVGRLYVIDEHSRQAIGTLAYPDIVGLLYRYCHTCAYSLRIAHKNNTNHALVPKILVRDIMTTSVKSKDVKHNLGEIIEELSMYRLGALLIKDNEDFPKGVISKTDLALAYKHRTGLKVEAGAIMSTPICSCDAKESLERGIHRMIFSEINRLFVYRDSPNNIIGVLSLSDSAKARSGSCQACTTSRITVQP